MKIDIIGRRFNYFFIAFLLVLVAVVALSTFGLKPGIEFSSGSLLTVSFENPVDQKDVETAISSLGFTAIVQQTGNQYLIRTKAITTDEKTMIEGALTEKFGKVTESQFASVSPIVATETATNAGYAVLAAAVGILLYITWAFRVMPRPFHYGVAAIVSLLHDVLVSVGIYAIIAGILHWEIDLMFITGILAVIGYSVNNTVIIFDRIRENVRLGVSPSFEMICNNSVVATLSRTLNTNITTLITLFALMFFVGSSIQNFVVVMTLGCVAGMYSSVYIAPALLVVWDKHEWGRFLGWIPGRAKA